MASATSFSSTTTTSSTQCSTSGRVSSPGSFTAMPSRRDHRTVRDALAGVRRAAGDLNADDFDLRVVALQRDGSADGEPAAAEGHDDPPDVRDIGDDLDADRRLAGDHGKIVVGMAERHARLRRTGACRRDGLGERRAAGDHGCAVRAACLHLRQRCAGGDEDLARHAAVAGGEREGLGVVASAPGDDTATAPRPRSSSFDNAPRSLNDPVRWRFSALSTIVPPHRVLSVPDDVTGVCFTTPR